jgi:phage portal protein BeeE
MACMVSWRSVRRASGAAEAPVEKKSNLKEARLALWEQTIFPLLHNITDALNNWLVPMFDTSLKLSIDLDAVPVLADKRDAY